MSSSILFPTNEYATSCKSSQEIQKLMIPLFSTIEQTIAHIVAKGTPLQMTFIYRNFHKCYKVAISTVCAKAPLEDLENQIIIAGSMKIILENQQFKLTVEQLESIFEMCVECMNNLHSAANEEMEAVLEGSIRSHPDRAKLVRRLEEVALDLGKTTQPIISKVTSGRLISILPKYVGRMLKGEMVDILKRILADNEVEAKKIWVSEIFPRLLQNLQLEFIELHLQQKIYESVYDQNEEVGILALGVILKNATKFSIEEQSSRIVKLFIDSLTSKNDKISLMATELMGEAYQKLQNIILRNENNCIRFWRSVIELSQSKNDRILNNLTYNLPGLLILANPIYRVEPICEIYIELFYQLAANKLLLSSYFHQIGQLFPQRAAELREVVYWMLCEVLEDEEPAHEAIRIINKIISNLHLSKNVFLRENSAEGEEGKQEERYFEPILCEYLLKYLNLLLQRKNGPHLLIFYNSLRNCYDCFSTQFVEQSLLPRLYTAVRMKTAYMELVIETVVCLLTKDNGSSGLINAYASKINIELSKSNRSYEREAALLFFYHASFHFSIEMFQEFRLGEKFLHFNNDKCFKNKVLFIKCLPRMIYFFNREEKIENALIITRLSKDPDQFVARLMETTVFLQNEETRQKIVAQSKILKEKERAVVAVQNGRRQTTIIRRASQEIAKEEVLKKRIETKSKTKIVIKDVTRRKTALVGTLGKNSSNLNFKKHS